VRNIPFGRPQIGVEERASVMDVLNGPMLVHGEVTTLFEDAFAKFTGAPYSVSVSSCTAAMHLVYLAMGIGPNDEVIVPAQTHTATAHAVELCGAKAVFVDAEANTGNIDVSAIRASITERTKAITIVHYLGVSVDMEEVVKIAQAAGLFVLEDCALAIGSLYKGTHVGLWGDAGCYSFYPVKHMTTGEGGMVVTQNSGLAEKISKLRAFGVDHHHRERKRPGMYDVTMLGYNYRMNEMEAAIGLEQVKKLPTFLRLREENFRCLSAALKGVNGVRQFEQPKAEERSSYYCLSVLLEDNLRQRRWKIIECLNREGIGTSIYYPKPVPMMSYYKDKYGYAASDFPIACDISDATISLPVGPHLTVDDMRYMAEKIIETLEAFRR
jgi:perosamine synthetase